ncbi:MAG: NAD(+) synthase [Myxococcales bacterium]|nr:NAD(+) synthase [Myxococcota bacterium]MDW8281815.1 NAD(+) synthase [Myxococcales bacterium]
MRLARLAVANVNSTVGAVRDNIDRCIALSYAMARDDVTLGAFPEHVIGGYPPEDLVQWQGFIAAEARELGRFCRETAALPTVLVLGLSVEVEGQVYNCAAVVHRGRVLGLCPKEKLPLYSVFYEARTFSRGHPYRYQEISLGHGIRGPTGDGIPFGDLVVRFDFATIAVEVCEDLWSPDGPMRRRCFCGAEVVANLSASPYRVGILETRREMVNTRAADNYATVVYVNAVGGNDGLVFDGGGFISQCGRQLLEAPRFREGIAAITVDLDRTRRLRTENTTWRTDGNDFLRQGRRVACVVAPEPTASGARLSYPIPPERSFFLPGGQAPPSPRERFCEELLDVIALGIGDYFEKTRAFRRIGVALSGGRDSLLCLLLAHRYVMRSAAGASESERRARVAQMLRAFYMPTRFSSIATRRAAEAAAADLGVPLVILPIDEAFDREVEAAARMLQPGEELTPITLQNIQARLRAQRMWNWSNATAGLFLQTGNMSEKAVGYTTIGGDLMGCIAPIANVPKTVVNYLLDYLLERHGYEGIRQTLAIPASAELADNQEDERDLMPFPVLDCCLALYAGEKLSPTELASVLVSMFPEYAPAQVQVWVDKFVSLFTQSIYKWVQAPLSIHIGNLDLERERALQLPVVSRLEWK